MNQLVPFHSGEAPVLIAAAGERARLRFLEFFTANIRNPHTRRAYARGVGEFLAWCESAGVASIAGVQPVQRRDLHRMARPPRARPALGADGQAAARRDPSSVRLACRRPGGAVNPAASVRGPTHVVKKGKTPVLSPDEARRLLDHIDVSTHAGLRDRALIGLMVYSCARIGAALAMKVEDVFVQDRRLWLRLREKGGKRPKCRATTISKPISRRIWTAAG